MFDVRVGCDIEGTLGGGPAEFGKPDVGAMGEGILDGIEPGIYPDVGSGCEGEEGRADPWGGVCIFRLMPTLLGVVGSGPRIA